jgi:alkanesulfonate monooxygenase SsuD/methylene tetrahydromethanopterin reductase-like flavin-dependent oxidoreductase (luciferase family)
MKFGIFILQPQRDGRKPVREAAAEGIQQVRMAEELGFDIAWFAEHHFSNYSLVTSPLTATVWAAPQTKKIRLGTAVIVAPLYEPMRLLEDIAVADQLSDGRLVLGFGAGYQQHECDRFGVTLPDSRPMMYEMLDLVERAWAGDGPLEYKGKHYDIPATHFGVRPIQQPHPPIAIAGMTWDETIQRRIARNGWIPFVSAQWKPASEVLETRHQIEAHWTAAGVDPAGLDLAVQRFVYVTEDRREALAAAEHLRYTYRIAHGFRQGHMDFDRHVIDSVAVEGEPSVEEIAERAIIGGPEKCAAQLIDEVRTLRPAHISCVMQFGGLEIGKVMRSMEMMGEKVIPAMERELGDLAGAGARAAAE